MLLFQCCVRCMYMHSSSAEAVGSYAVAAAVVVRTAVQRCAAALSMPTELCPMLHDWSAELSVVYSML
jgi:hypothetical protein